MDSVGASIYKNASTHPPHPQYNDCVPTQASVALSHVEAQHRKYIAKLKPGLLGGASSQAFYESAKHMDGGMDGGIHELKYPHSPRVPVPHDPRMQALTWLDGQERSEQNVENGQMLPLRAAAPPRWTIAGHRLGRQNVTRFL